MQKKIMVRHTHRYTNERAILFEGIAMCEDFDTYREYRYSEKDGTKVVMYCYEDHIQIERFGMIHSCLNLYENRTTKNPMESVYGIFDIEMTTFAYRREDRYVMVEYDVESGTEEKDGFIIELEEVINEYN